MMPSRFLSSRSSSIAARAFAPSKPRDAGMLKKTSTDMPTKTKSNGAQAKAPGPIYLQTHFVVSEE